MNRITSLVLKLTLLLVALSSMAAAQVTSAKLSGTLVDATGAAIAGATVTAANNGTNLVQTTTTSGAGAYSFNSLPPGQYTLTTALAGFAPHIEKDVVLTVGQSATLNISLTAGGASDTVTVTGGAELINTTTAEISTVIDEAQIKEIPINNRDPSALVYLSAGVTNEINSQAASTQTQQSFNSQTGASAGGGRQGSTWYLLDGVPNMDTTTLLAAPFPNSDATQEFRVITNNFDARYGFAPNAVVSILTKSGTNSIHGGVFEFIRNYEVNAKQYFSHQTDGLRRNIFGGYIGAPIIKDKLFVFANFQGNRQNSTATQNSADTPTAAMLAGDFSALVDAKGNPIVLHGPVGQPNPFTTVNGKINQVNPALFSKGALALEQSIPVGQQPSTGQLYFANPAVHQNYTEGTGRLDYIISGNQTAFVRFFADELNIPGGNTPGNILTGVSGQNGVYLNVAANHTWTISPTLLNSITAAYMSYDLNSGTIIADKSGNPVCLSQYIAVSDPPGACYLNLSVYDGNGYYSGASEGFNAFNSPPYTTVRRDWVLNDTVTKVLGKHTLAAGVDLLHRHYYEFNGYSVSPSIGFDGHYSGFILADWLLGYGTGINQSTAEVGATNGWMLGLYLQDQYKLRPNLTVNAGLRWDPNIVPKIEGNRGAAFIPGAQSTRFPNAPQNLVFAGEDGIPSGLVNTTYGYFQPRIGIAWQVKPKMSVRAGIGLFTTPLEDAFYNRVFDSQPFNPGYGSQPSANTPFSFDNPWASDAYTNFKNPFPPFPSANYSPGASTTFNTPVGLSAVFQPNYKLGVTQSWNLSIDRQFGDAYALHLTYVGLQSYHQATTVDLNPGHYFGPGDPRNQSRTTYTNFTNVLQVQDGGTASYHAAQLGFERRMKKGLQFQSNFTWSKAMDVGGSGDPTFESSVSDPYDIHHDHGPSSLNYPFLWVSNFIYQAPSLKGSNALLRNALGGWEVSGIYNSLSGAPFTINGGNGNNNSAFDEGQDRADVVQGVPLNVRQGGKSHWLNQYLNPAAFTQNAPGTPGNSQKYSIQGPFVEDLDAAVMKNFSYRERYKLQLRFEAYNALNHASFGAPNNNAGDPAFGQITSGGPFAPRQLQAAAKITF
jgi:Carboxypeptidase regulatory-like domain